GAVSSNFAVNPAGANQLTVLTQPSLTATAGVAFAQQPVIRIEDQFGNLRSSDNSTTLTASINTGGGTLQGTTTMTATNGIVTFTNLSRNVAGTITLRFSSGGLSSAGSIPITVSAE